MMESKTLFMHPFHNAFSMSKIEIDVDICVETDKDLDTWLDEFIDWIESRGEIFGGSIKLFDEKTIKSI